MAHCFLGGSRCRRRRSPGLLHLRQRKSCLTLAPALLALHTMKQTIRTQLMTVVWAGTATLRAAVAVDVAVLGVGADMNALVDVDVDVGVDVATLGRHSAKLSSYVDGGRVSHDNVRLLVFLSFRNSSLQKYYIVLR